MDSQKSLWGDLSNTAIFRTPFTILKEQAAILSQQTKGLLVGEVKRYQDENEDISLSLYIVAPSLGDYRYEVVQVYHDITIYPLIVRSMATEDPSNPRHSEQEFEQALGEILSSLQVKRVISALLSDIHASRTYDTTNEFDIPF